MYTLTELQNLPTISQGQADDLKIDTGTERVWLCRCGVADGMPHDNNVIREQMIDNRWVRIEEYEGKAK